jgi:hypothetical protein
LFEALTTTGDFLQDAFDACDPYEGRGVGVPRSEKPAGFFFGNA